MAFERFRTCREYAGVVFTDVDRSITTDRSPIFVSFQAKRRSFVYSDRSLGPETVVDTAYELTL